MDLARYAELFLTESRDHLAAVNQWLLEWERRPAAPEPVGEIFRAVHTIKGMAATMGYSAVADLAHRMENVLDRLRAVRQPAAPGLLELLFRATDQLEVAIAEAVAGRSGAVPPALVAALDAAAQPPGASAQPAPEPAAPRGPAGSAEPGTGLAVRVRLRADAPLKGPRAVLVLARARELGTVEAVSPPPQALEREDFDGELSFRLETQAAPEAVEQRLRAAGEVERVWVAAAAPAERRAEAAGGRHVRVDRQRLDQLTNLVGELVILRGRLLELAGRSDDGELADLSRRVGLLVSELHDEVVQLRLIPVWQVFDRFPRLVRDLAQRLGKEIEFVVEGKELELDRALLDEVSDPLVHLLRNAVDHGLEPPAERLAAGKPPRGRLVLSAAREREAVAIRVSDDGRGIDRELVLRQAREAGWVGPEVEVVSDDQLLRLVARPGFSTAQRVSEVSGRGVGLDVVLSKIRAVGGAVELRTERGSGTTFTLRLPTSLAVVRALLAEVGGERYALPLTHVAETLDLDPRRVVTVDGRRALDAGDRLIPLIEARQLLGIEGEPPPRRPVVVVELGERRSGLVVDAMLGQQEIMVKPFRAPRGLPAIFSGATILGDGRPALILDVAGLS